MDVTVPGSYVPVGKQHPLTKVIDEAKEIFIGMGFTVAEGPEIELSEYNFTRLNTQEGHPARDRQDTFYFDGKDSVCLRTQTSPVQVRVMESQSLPIRIISPGRVYRKDEVDATHSPMMRLTANSRKERVKYSLLVCWVNFIIRRLGVCVCQKTIIMDTY